MKTPEPIILSVADDGRYAYSVASIWDVHLPLNDISNIDDIAENGNNEIIVEQNITSSSNSDFSTPPHEPLRIMPPKKSFSNAAISHYKQLCEQKLIRKRKKEIHQRR